MNRVLRIEASSASRFILLGDDILRRNGRHVVLRLDIRRFPVIFGGDGHALDLLDVLALDEHHDASEPRDDAAEGDKRARGPRRALVPIVVVHVIAQHDLEEGVPAVHPDDVVHLPRLGGRRAVRSGWGIGCLLGGDGDGRVVFVHVGGARGGRELLGAGQAEPALVDTGEASDTDLGAVLSADAPPGPPVEIAEAPRGQAEAGDAEEGVEDLRVDLDPDAARGLEVIAGRGAHGRRSIAQQQEQHSTPGDNIEAVEGDEEAGGGKEPFPEAFEADDGGLLPGNFGRRDITVGVLVKLDGEERHVTLLCSHFAVSRASSFCQRCLSSLS